MINFATPELLLLLPLPWLIRYVWPMAKPSHSHALKIPFYKNLLQNMQSYSYRRALLLKHYFLIYFIWLLLVIAVAGPQWLGKAIVLPQSGRDIMIAVDLSGSMQIPDMTLNGVQVSRLDVVKDAAEQFIDDRVGDRIGLILFGTRAYLQTPLTFDRKAVGQALEDATVGLAGNQTAIGDAIGLAIKQLQRSAWQNRVLVLLTDGVSNAGHVSPQEAADIAAKLHIKIYTIGLGSTQMLTNNGLLNPFVLDPDESLDEKGLKQIAQTTGGLFFNAENAEDLEKIYQQLNQLEPVVSDQNILRPLTPLYPWPLGLAFGLSFIVVLRRIAFPNKFAF